MMNGPPNNRQQIKTMMGRKADSTTKGLNRVKRATDSPRADRNRITMPAVQQTATASGASSTHRMGNRKKK